MHVADILENVLGNIQKKLETEEGGFIETGYTDVDSLTCGFKPGELITLAAAPGMGSYHLLTNVVTSVAFENKKVAFFSTRFSKEQILINILSSVSQVPTKNMLNGNLTDEEQDRLMEGARRVHEGTTSLYIFEHFEGDIKSTVDFHLTDEGVNVIDKNDKVSTDEGKVDFIAIDNYDSSLCSARELLILANRLNIPVIVNISLDSRYILGRPDKRPKLNDLYSTNPDLYRLSTTILFLYRHDFYDPNSELKDIAELIVAKNDLLPRQIGTTKLVYQPHYSAFQNLYLRDQ